MRTLCHDLPASTPGTRSRSRAGCTAAASCPASPSWCCATAAAWPRWCCRRGTPCRPRRPPSASPAPPPPTPQAPGGVEVTDAQVEALTEDALTPPVELWRPDPRRLAADPARPRAGAVAPPGPARPVGARRRLAARLPVHPRRAGLHRGRDPEARRVGDRVGRQRLRRRLLRAAGLPRAEPAVLQAAAGRRLRAGLRGRAGLPRRAARHRPPPRGVPLASTSSSASSTTTATCCAVLREVLAGMVDAVAEEDVGPSRAAAARLPGRARGDPGHALRRRARPRRRARRTSPTWPPSTSAPSARGRWPSTARTCSPSRATRWPSGRSTPTRTPGDERWSNSFDLLFRGLELVTGGQRLHRPSTTRRPSAPAARTRRPTTSYLQAFRHGMPPHGGFAIGLERWVARLVGGDQHPRGHALPARPAPADALRRHRRPDPGVVDATRRRRRGWCRRRCRWGCRSCGRPRRRGSRCWRRPG